MDFSYEKDGLKVGIVGAETADDVVKIMHEILGDQQSEIDQITAEVKEQTGRLSDSQAGLDQAITNEKEN